MALSVFPELMDKIDPQDPDSSLRTIENYINYMVERVEFSLTNTFRTTTSLGSSAEAGALVLEDTVNKLSEASSQLAILQGVVNDLLHDIRDYETLDNKPQIASVELVGDKSLAQLGIASQADQTALEGRVSDLETTGGEPNVIETVKRNGTALPVTDKAVDVTVPTKVSDLTNDSGYQTAGQVQAAVSGKADSSRLESLIAFLLTNGPVIFGQPQDVVVGIGQTAVFPVIAEGNGLTYQWYYRNPRSTGGNFAPSSNTTDTYSVKANATTHSQGFFVYCVVTDSSGHTAQTRTASMTLQS